MTRHRCVPRIVPAAAVVLPLTFGVVGAAAAAHGTATGGPPSGPTVSIQLAADPETLDPHTARTALGLQASAFLYDTLTHRVAGETVSGLATSWDVEADRAVFTIRDDATCADGTPVTPSVIKASYERLMDPATGAPYAVKELGYPDPVFVADDDAGTFTIELPSPFSDLLHNSSHPSTAVICPSGLEDPESLATTSHGSGAFVVADIVRGDHYVLRARDGYAWGPDGAATGGPQSPAEVRLRVVENATTAANLLLSGELNIVALEGEERQRVAESGDFLVDDGLAGLETLMFNHADGRVTADEVVRQAVSMAIDRESYASVRTDGFGEVATSFLSEESSCFTSASEALPPFDLDAARLVLEDAGWERGDGGVYAKDGERLKLRIVIAATLGSSAPELLQQLLSEMGADVDLQVVEGAVWQETLYESGDWDLTTVPFGDHSTPSSFAAYFSGPPPPNGANWAHIAVDEYEQRRDEALATVDDGRCALWHEAELALLDGFHVLPLTSVPNAAIGNGVEFRRIQYLMIDPSSLLVAD